MKRMMPYIILFGVTTLLAIGVGFGVAYLKPDLFHSRDQKPQVTKDSTQAVRPRNANDTVQTQSVMKKDSVVIVWEDTVKTMRAQLGTQQKRIAEMEQKERRQIVVTDSAKVRRRAQFTKLVESMNVEEAAKVLANMKDEDVKAILLNVKARQASKILGMLEPRRAARLMN
jgi:flagellar motility protein MotE (MotC chaperone)